MLHRPYQHIHLSKAYVREEFKATKLREDKLLTSVNAGLVFCPKVKF